MKYLTILQLVNLRKFIMLNCGLAIAALFDLVLIVLLGQSAIIFQSSINADELSKNNIFNIIGASVEEMLMILIFAVVLSMMFRIYIVNVQFKFVAESEANVSTQLLHKIINENILTIFSYKQTEMSKVILTEVQQIIGQGVMSIANAFSASVILIAIGGYLLIVEPFISMGIVAAGCFYYLIVYLTANKKIVDFGLQRTSSNTQKFKIINEIFGTVVEIKLQSLQTRVLALFEKQAQIFSLALSKSQVMALLPRYILEGLVLFSGIVYLYFIFNSNTQTTEKIELTILMIFSSIKLLPNAQALYYNLVQLKYLEHLIANVEKIKKMQSSQPIHFTNKEKFLLEDSIVGNNLEFEFIDDNKTEFFTFNFRIDVGKRTLISGESGSGKSTLLHLILGFYSPKHGALKYDGVSYKDFDFLAWHKSVGYVGQRSFFLDGTIQDNLYLFQEKDSHLNNKNELEMLQALGLTESLGLNNESVLKMVVGENGSNLSGGQRQRLAICRALLNDPSILILDEATNALDAKSEKMILEYIFERTEGKTFLMISHREDIWKHFDNNIQLIKKNDK